MIFVQVISILFAVISAKISAPIVTRFENKGATVRQMTLLHRYTFLAKAAFCASISLWFIQRVAVAAFSGLLAALWIYLLFDPILSISRRPARLWHYLGLNDADGRFWNGTFGKNAGKWKAAILFLAVITTNILYYAHY